MPALANLGTLNNMAEAIPEEAWIDPAASRQLVIMM
jgi:hypothetical protein